MVTRSENLSRADIIIFYFLLHDTFPKPVAYFLVFFILQKVITHLWLTFFRQLIVFIVFI